MCAITHSYVRHITHTCDIIYSYVRHDSSICVSWLIPTCAITHSHLRHDSYMCAQWLIHMCAMTHYCAPWLVYMCAITHSYVHPHAFMCAPWRICICAKTHAYMRHDLYISHSTTYIVKDTYICMLYVYMYTYYICQPWPRGSVTVSKCHKWPCQEQSCHEQVLLYKDQHSRNWRSWTKSLMLSVRVRGSILFVPCWVWPRANTWLHSVWAVLCPHALSKK